MSKKSDEYERAVANYIDSMEGVVAIRPKFGTQYSDVFIVKDNRRAWLEVKMNHSDQIANPRFFFKDSVWHTTYNSFLADRIVNRLNISNDTKLFVEQISDFCGLNIDNLRLTTNRKDIWKSSITIDQIKRFFKNRNQYILDEECYDLDNLIQLYFSCNKAEPVNYIQIGDDFYKTTFYDPLRLQPDIPIFSGKGKLRVRVSCRTNFYEIQAEIKVATKQDSLYSVMPQTQKYNPFYKFINYNS